MFSGSRPSTLSGMLDGNLLRCVSIKNFQTKSYLGNINGCADMGVFEMFFDEHAAVKDMWRSPELFVVDRRTIEYTESAVLGRLVSRSTAATSTIRTSAF